MTEINKKQSKEDSIKIANEVIATIAGIAASGVENVTSLSGGLADGIVSILGRKNLGKGVKVEVGEKEAAINISVVVEYGCKIQLVGKEIQNKVREAVGDMTGLDVIEIVVNVLGVNVDKEAKKQLEEE